MANHKQEPWKMPLHRYIEHLYKKHMGKEVPDDVRSMKSRYARSAPTRKQRLEQERQDMMAYNTSFKRTPQSGAA